MVGWLRRAVGGGVVKRPQVAGCRVTTPNAGDMIQLLGSGPVHSGLAVTHDEHRALQRLYGYTAEPTNERPPAPVAPKREDFADGYEHGHAMREHERAVRVHAEWKDPREFYQAGADRGLMRHAEADGLRMVAWFARFIPPGEDPLKYLVQLTVERGWDITPEDVAWAADEADDCDETEEEEESAAE